MMATPLSAGMLNNSRNSNSSVAESRTSGRKRSFPACGLSVRPDNSLSGYSADREDSSSSPPFSIDVSNEATHDNIRDMNSTHDNIRDMNSCPKRQKRHELQFAASSIKADLARAGYEFPTVDPTIENTTTLGPVSINLKGVKLVHSKAFQRIPTVIPCSVAASMYDYQALALACTDSYPSILNRSTHSENNVSSSFDSTRSTSSVSESDTESVTSKSNGDDILTISIPPLFKEDEVQDFRPQPYKPSSCNVIASKSSSISMSESLALTKTPRVVALSSNPFAIVHANAACLQMLGMPSGRVVGSGFTSIAKSPCTNDDTQPPIFLSDYMLSSCSGNHQKIQLVHHEDELHPPGLIERYLRVLPIVGSTTLSGSAVLNVSHFSVEFLSDNDRQSGSLGSSSNNEMSNIKRQTHAGDMAVGVMG